MTSDPARLFASARRRPAFISPRTTGRVLGTTFFMCLAAGPTAAYADDVMSSSTVSGEAGDASPDTGSPDAASDRSPESAHETQAPSSDPEAPTPEARAVEPAEHESVEPAPADPVAEPEPVEAEPDAPESVERRPEPTDTPRPVETPEVVEAAESHRAPDAPVDGPASASRPVAPTAAAPPSATTPSASGRPSGPRSRLVAPVAGSPATGPVSSPTTPAAPAIEPDRPHPAPSLEAVPAAPPVASSGWHRADEGELLRSLLGPERDDAPRAARDRETVPTRPAPRPAPKGPRAIPAPKAAPVPKAPGPVPRDAVAVLLDRLRDRGVPRDLDASPRTGGRPAPAPKRDAGRPRTVVRLVLPDLPERRILRRAATTPPSSRPRPGSPRTTWTPPPGPAAPPRSDADDHTSPPRRWTPPATGAPTGSPRPSTPTATGPAVTAPGTPASPSGTTSTTGPATPSATATPPAATRRPGSTGPGRASRSAARAPRTTTTERFVAGPDRPAPARRTPALPRPSGSDAAPRRSYPQAPAPRRAPWASGVFLEDADASHRSAASRAAGDRGRGFDVTGARLRVMSWDDLFRPSGAFTALRSTPGRKVLTVPLTPPGARASACAKGDYRQYWERFGARLTTLDRRGVVLDLDAGGTAGDSADAYVGCFRQVVGAVRHAAPATRIQWTARRGASSGATPVATWPGRGWVDIVGIDALDTGEDWTRSINGAYGLNWWADFAAGQGRQVALARWGSYPGSTASAANAPYVQGMRDWIVRLSHRDHLAYELYTPVPGQGGDAAAAYRELFRS